MMLAVAAVPHQQQAAWVTDLVQQGLLPLSRRGLLAARLVCLAWRAQLSPLVGHLTLPYDAWATASSARRSGGGAPGSNASSALQQLDYAYWRSAAAVAAAAVAAVAADDDEELAAAAAAGGGAGAASKSTLSPKEGGGGEHLQQPPDSDGAAAGLHQLRNLAAAFPSCTSVTLTNRRWENAQPAAAPTPAAVRASLEALGQLSGLTSLVVQGYMQQAEVQPLLAGLSGPPPPGQQQEQHGSLGAAAGGQAALPLLQLGTQLRRLELQGLGLPPPRLIEGLLWGLQGLRQFVLHSSMESSLEAPHLDALGVATQLELLHLHVYQVNSHRLPLDSLLALTNLQQLEVSYSGIFADQRPAFNASIAALARLTRLATAGLASPLLPQPALTALRSFRAAGLTKRLPESALQLISSCNSSSLQDLSLEAGRRGIAAVAAEQLEHLGFINQLTSLSLALSKGTLPAANSVQQLTQLSGLTALKSLTLGSGDHRMAVTSERLQELAAQWPRLESLRLSGFAPLQGFSGLGAFTGLTALSLKPGVGTGKLLLDLDVALQQLGRLRRLHLDFRSALQLEHVEAVAAACASSLQHLSLNLWSSGIGSKALQAIGACRALTSLQLLNLRAVVLSGPPGIAAVRSLPRLKLLCVQAADEVITEQKPTELGAHLIEVLVGQEGCPSEVRVWLGSGVEARQAEARLAGVLARHLPDCTFRTLREPERPIL